MEFSVHTAPTKGAPMPSRRSKLSVHSRSSSTSAAAALDRKSTRLNSSHSQISYAVFCLKKKKNIHPIPLLVTEYQGPSRPRQKSHIASYLVCACSRYLRALVLCAHTSRTLSAGYRDSVP